MGLLADLAAAHSRGWRGDWLVSLGSVSLELGLPLDAEVLEEFWVFLIELVDSDGGEWSLRAGEDELTIEAQVFGPDVNFEFVSEGSSPRFGGAALPRRATVRLRAVVCEGTAFLASLVSESCRIDPGLRGREDLAGLEADLTQAQEAVASLPGTFGGKS